MKRDEALNFKRLIEDLCEKNSAYCFVTDEKKPTLTGIRVEISIKVEAEDKRSN